MSERTCIVHGAVGKRTGEALLSRSASSTLTSSAVFVGGRVTERVPYVDLEAYLAVRRIKEVDVLKIDVEGSEYDLIETFPNLFGMARILLLELHDLDGRQQAARSFLRSRGLVQAGPAL